MELDGSDKEDSFLYVKIQRCTGPNHILMDNEKDKWDHINDKFFVANILLGDIKKLLKTKEKLLEAKKVGKKRQRLIGVP